MHELIQIRKKNATETNLKALSPIIGSFAVQERVNLLIAYVPFACEARRLFGFFYETFQNPTPNRTDNYD